MWFHQEFERNLWSDFDEYFRHLDQEFNKMEVALNKPHRPSLKAKATRSSTMTRHRKRATAHLRPQHLDEELSAVTTAEDDEINQRVKHVPGSTQTRHLPDPSAGGLALCRVSKLLLIIIFLSKLPQTQMEWARHLESQQRYHDDKLEKWQKIIKSYVVLLDEMRRSFLQHAAWNRYERRRLGGKGQTESIPLTADEKLGPNRTIVQ